MQRLAELGRGAGELAEHEHAVVVDAAWRRTPWPRGSCRRAAASPASRRRRGTARRAASERQRADEDSGSAPTIDGAVVAVDPADELARPAGGTGRRRDVSRVRHGELDEADASRAAPARARGSARWRAGAAGCPWCSRGDRRRARSSCRAPRRGSAQRLGPDASSCASRANAPARRCRWGGPPSSHAAALVATALHVGSMPSSRDAPRTRSCAGTRVWKPMRSAPSKPAEDLARATGGCGTPPTTGTGCGGRSRSCLRAAAAGASPARASSW